MDWSGYLKAKNLTDDDLTRLILNKARVGNLNRTRPTLTPYSYLIDNLER